MKGTRDDRSNLPEKLNQRSADHDHRHTGSTEGGRAVLGLHVEAASRKTKGARRKAQMRLARAL
jgi:hypothetical protein